MWSDCPLSLANPEDKKDHSNDLCLLWSREIRFVVFPCQPHLKHRRSVRARVLQIHVPRVSFYNRPCVHVFFLEVVWTPSSLLSFLSCACQSRHSVELSVGQHALCIQNVLWFKSRGNVVLWNTFKKTQHDNVFSGSLSSFVSLKVCLLGFPLQEYNDFVTKCYWSVLFWKPLAWWRSFA